MGHTHPKVVAAIQDQAQLLIHANSCDYLTLPQIEYAQRILALSPGEFPKRIFFSNSGTEAVECGMNEPRRKRTGYRPLMPEITYNLLLYAASGGVLDP